MIAKISKKEVITEDDIEPLYDQNSYRCRLNFTIFGSDEIETVNFILTR